MLGQVPMMQQGAGAGGYAFPANYPYAFSSPLPSAILRPLQQPLYDTENLPIGAPVGAQEIAFFQRQLGQTMALVPAGAAKTESETNLTQPGQLPNPQEFSVFGFNMSVPAGVVLADFLAIYLASVFQFLYTGNRIYLQVPANRIPAGVAAEGFAGAAGGTTIHQGVGHVSNFYKFTIGRSALRIRPTEAFQVRLRWPLGAITITAVTRIQVFILGLTWNAL